MKKKCFTTFDEIYPEVQIWIVSCVDRNHSSKECEELGIRTAIAIYELVNELSGIDQFHQTALQIFDEWRDVLAPPQMVVEEDVNRKFSDAIFYTSTVLETFVIKRRPHIAKDPLFFQFVKEVILEKRYGFGRVGFIENLLPKLKSKERIDFSSYFEEPLRLAYIPWIIRACVHLKDGRYVKEAEEALREKECDYRAGMKRYIERYKTDA